MITQTELRQLLDYDADWGIFIWRETLGNNVVPGTIAGTVGENGYRYIRIRNKAYTAARLAWFYIYGVWPESDLDHINGNRDDNTLSNIRLVTKSQNQWNKGLQKNNTSGVKGVCWNKHNNKWMSYIKVNGKNKTLGYYTSLEEATRVRKEAEIEHHGKYRRK